MERLLSSMARSPGAAPGDVIATCRGCVAARLGSGSAAGYAMGAGTPLWLSLLQLSSLTSVFVQIDDRLAEAGCLGRDWRLE